MRLKLLHLVNVSICCVFVPLDLQFGLVSPAQGLTWADDLSSHDLTSLGFICHIELSTFLQTLGVQSKRTRSRRLRTRGAFQVPAQCGKCQRLSETRPETCEAQQSEQQSEPQ